MKLTESALRQVVTDLRRAVRADDVSCLHWAALTRARIEQAFGVPCQITAGYHVMRYSRTSRDGVLGYGSDLTVALTALGSTDSFDGHVWAEVGGFIVDCSFPDRLRSARRLYEADGKGKPPSPWPYLPLPFVAPIKYASRAEMLRLIQGRDLGFAYSACPERTAEAQRRCEFEAIRHFARLADAGRIAPKLP